MAVPPVCLHLAFVRTTHPSGSEGMRLETPGMVSSREIQSGGIPHNNMSTPKCTDP